MNKMMNPEMEVVRFEAADILTSSESVHALYDGTYIYTQSSTFDKGNVTDTDKQDWIKWENNEGEWFTAKDNYETELTDPNSGWGLTQVVIDQMMGAQDTWFRQWGDGSWSVCKDSTGAGHYPGAYNSGSN